MEALQIRQDNAHIREQATYALLTNQLDSALELARDNWQQQRETADIILYATAAIKTGSDKDIKIIQQFITDNNYEYPALERDLRLGKISGCLDCQPSATQAASKTAFADYLNKYPLHTMSTINPINMNTFSKTMDFMKPTLAVSPLSIKEVPL